MLYRSVWIATVTAMFVAMTQTVTSAASLMHNGDFDQQQTGWQVQSDIEQSVHIDDYDYYRPPHVLRIDHAEQGTTRVQQTIQGIYSSNTYTLTCWIKPGLIKSQSKDGGARVFVLGRDGKPLAASVTFTRQGAWQPVTLAFNSAANNTVTVVLQLQNATGQVRFDNVQLVSGRVDTQADQIADDPTLVNIAGGKTYTMSRPPNYPLTKDDADNSDLTDGIRTVGQYWTQKSTVGWQHTRGPVVITVDLEQVQPIRGVALGTGAGGAGVTYPQSIVVSVSDDGKTFRVAGDLIRMSEGRLPAPGYGESDDRAGIHTYRTRGLNTIGRFVRFNVVPSGIFFFTDEIEIYRGSDQSTVSTGTLLTDEFVADPVRLTQLGTYRRIRRDAETVSAMVLGSGLSSVERSAAFSELSNVIATNERTIYPTRVEGFEAIAPLNDLHARIYAVHARLLADRGCDALHVWHTHAYQLLSSWGAPAGELDKLQLKQMQGERRAEVINLTNTTAKPMKVNVGIEGLPFVTVQQVLWVDTRVGRMVGSAIVDLEKMNGRTMVTVPAGMTRQLWVRSEPTTKHAGVSRGKIRLSTGVFKHSVDFDIDVVPVRMSEKPALSMANWDYIYNGIYGITEQNRSQATALLFDGLTNGVWATASTVPIPKANQFDAQGNLTGEIDFTKWDGYVRMFPQAEHYFVFMVWNRNVRPFGMELSTDRYRTAMAQWAAAWAKHNRQIGLRPGQAKILFVDEPAAADIPATVAFCQAFKAGTNEIGIFNDPHAYHGVHHADGEALLKVSDIVCPTLSHLMVYGEDLQKRYRQVPDSGSELWLYSCNGPTRMFDPSYYRLHAWHCFELGATGQGFWAFGDTGTGGGVGDNWNEYIAIAGQSFTAAYVGPNRIATSKHWEAAREGVQDYQYLYMLEQLVAARESAGDKSDQTRQARKLVDGIAQQVVNQAIQQDGRWYVGQWNNHSIFADEARQKVLDAILDLQ